MKAEKNYNAQNGYLMLFVILILLGIGVVTLRFYVGALIIFLAIIMLAGFVLVNPNSSRVLLLFGKYVGTIKENGLFWVNPLFSKKRISLRASNFDSERLKVNDKLAIPS